MGLEPLAAIGDFPPFLVRSYSSERWARALVDDGYLRLSLPQYFAEIEDPVRADRTEGHAHLQIPGTVHTARLDADANVIAVTETPGYVHLHGQFVNPVYVACFSYPPGGDLAQLPTHFGEHRVIIDEPQRFAQDMTDWLTAEAALRGTPVVECWPVSYNKGEKGQDPQDNLERLRLNYSQKPARFAMEHEYRFAVVATPFGQCEPALHHTIRLGRRLPYARYIPPAV